MSSEETVQSQDEEAIIKALERFVVENDDLLELESLIGRFNIFDALGIARAEIRHSNFLAFILDPRESHGQGTIFLQPFLMDVLKQSPIDRRPISPIDLDGAELRGVSVKREWKNTDLLITCKDPRLIVVIENKVDSHEAPGQLEKYETRIAKSFPEDDPLFVFLTPSGYAPSGQAWMPYSYEQIFRTFTRVRNMHSASIGDEFRTFLDHYLNLLRSRFMKDERLDQLCQQIYKNHRQALDIIWERAGVSDSPALDIAADIVDSDDRWELIWHSNKYIDFCPKSWLEWLPYSEQYYQFSVHLRFWPGKLAFVLFVGPMKNKESRAHIVESMRKISPTHGFKPTKAYSVKGKFNRICSRETLVEWNDESEIDSDSFRDNLEEKVNSLFMRLEKLAPEFESLFGNSSK